MGRSYLEALFRYKYLLMIPIVLGFVAGTVVAFQAPRKYLVGATIWADTAVPYETTVGTTGGQSPPSAGQATLLTQLLGTRSFLASVIQVTPMADDYRAASPVDRTYQLYELSGSVQVGTPGPQLLSVSVIREDPDEAISLTEAVLTQFEQYRMDEAVQRAKAVQAYQLRQLETAQEGLDNSEGSRAAESAYADALSAYEQSSLDVQMAQTSGMRLVDPPDLALPQARRKTLMLGAVGGAIAGLTVSLLALILQMARDKSVRGEREAADVLGLEVVGSIPSVGRDHRRDLSSEGV